jgi:hypothetical protein
MVEELLVLLDQILGAGVDYEHNTKNAEQNMVMSMMGSLMNVFMIFMA